MIRGAAIGFAAAVALWLTGATAQLGAHPLWANKVVLIGAPIGLVFFALSYRIGPRLQILLSLLILAAAFAAAHFGKAAFAASFAESRGAGVFWYAGWIGTCAGLVAFISSFTGKRAKTAPR